MLRVTKVADIAAAWYGTLIASASRVPVADAERQG
jgi:hypothetical protein